MNSRVIDRRKWLRLTVVSAIVGCQLHGLGLAEIINRYDANMAERMLDLNTVELRVQLRNGLRVFLPEQQTFLESVLTAVESDQLPRSMVNMVYVWSLRRNPKVPFPYFEIAMRALAKKRGVTL